MMEIYNKPIAVLGGGAGGQTMAADLALAGKEVRLYELPEFEEGIKEVMETGKIEITGKESNTKGFKRNGVAEIDVVTTDMGEALKDVGLINVSIPALGHKLFFEKMMPHLKDGQIVNIFPDNFGSLLLRRMLIKKDADIDIIVGGWSSLPYATRRRGVELGRVNVANRTIELRGDTLPSKHQDDFWKIMNDFPPLDPNTLVRGDTMLDIGLSNPNPVVHVPGSLLNIAQMENYGRPEKIYGDEGSNYSLYVEGTSPSVAKVMIGFYREECRIAEAIGINIVNWEEKDFMSKSNIMLKHYMGKDYMIPFESREWDWVVGPHTVQDRYFTEDIPIGTHVYYELAKKFDVDVPIIESLIKLGSIVCDRDFMREGRSLEDLGLAHMSKDEMLEYLREGENTEKVS